ncbi:MAG: hypothetical protein IKI97_08215 [Clostridia bacterium]|nr:hypothetical protein [Clostridia bacterium]
MMKTKIFSMVFAILMLCCSMTTAFAAQGTDGDELHVVEAQKLEIQLGTEWAGVEFMLRTDAGVYPGVIPVDETGVLSLEIGGSKTYILSCLQSSVDIPDLTLLQAPVTSETEPDKDDLVDIKDKEPAVPTSHIIMFVGGIVIAIGILVAIYISNKNRQIVQDDDEDDDF